MRVAAFRLTGHLGAGAGTIPLSGVFVAQRSAGRLARTSADLLRVTTFVSAFLGDHADHVAAKTFSDWTVKINFQLTFSDVTAELWTQDGGVRAARGVRGGTEIPVRITCPELVAATYRAAQWAEDVAGRIGPVRPKTGRRPGEVARDLWVVACLQLGLGQDKAAYGAAGTGVRILRGGGSLHPGDKPEVRAAGTVLSGQLRLAGQDHLAGQVDDLLAHLGGCPR